MSFNLRDILVVVAVLFARSKSHSSPVVGIDLTSTEKRKNSGSRPTAYCAQFPTRIDYYLPSSGTVRPSGAG